MQPQYIRRHYIRYFIMNASQIRSKYRDILDDSDSDDEEISLKQRVSLLRTRVLTEHNQNLSQSTATESQPSGKIIVALKERIAQGIKNLDAKNEEISSLKQQISRLEAKNKLYSDELSASKQVIETKQAKILEQRVKSGGLQLEIKRLKEKLSDEKVENELIFKQADYYKKQISHLKRDKQSFNKKMDSIDKELKDSEKLKNMNNRLKEDLKRIHVILNQYIDKNSSKKIEGKHYLGKPFKEYQSWYPQNLIGEVECFLKKEQVAQGNKQFLQNLVKFIERYSKSSKREKRSQSHKTRFKTEHSRAYSSLCEKHETNAKTQFLGKSNLKDSIMLSRWTKNTSKKYTQSLLYSQPNTLQTKCQLVLSQFHKILNQTLTQKQIKKKTILKLAKEMSGSIMSLFQQENYAKN